MARQRMKKRRHIHTRPRHDSSIVRLWRWGKRRRLPFTARELSESIDASESRIRTVLSVLHDHGLVKRVQEHERDASGAWQPAVWALSNKRPETPPVMIVKDGNIVGVRIR